MNPSRRRAATYLGLLACPLPVLAQGAYPTRAVTLVVPYPPGGAVDILGRVVNTPLGRALGQSVVIDNVSGGSGSIGAAKVARAAPDGYTLLVGTTNDQILAPLLNPAVGYRTEDFAPIGKIGDSSFILGGRPGLAARTIDELIELARQRPGSLTYATSGIGSAQHVVMQDLQERTRTSMLHVPYRGGSAMIGDVLGGQVDLTMVATVAVAEHLASGRLHAFGTAGLKRDELVKNIPTLNEGRYLKGLDHTGWVGLFGPAKIPPEVSQRLVAAMAVVMASPEVVSQLRRAGFTPAGTAEQAGFGAYVIANRAHVAGIVSRIKLEKAEGAR